MKKSRFSFYKTPVLIATALVLGLFACNNESTETPSETESKPVAFVAKAPAFNQDSAYFWVQKQVEFGPRVPGSKAHANCASMIENTLKSYGLTVVVQSAPVTTYDGKIFTLKNKI